MSNYCNNLLTIEGNAETLRIIKVKFDSDSCFESLIGKNPNFAPDDILDHNQMTYGTICDISKEDVSIVSDGDNRLKIFFETNSSPVVPFVQKMAMKYNVKVKIQYWEQGYWIAGEACFDTSGIQVDYKTYDYLVGTYRFDRDYFFENEVEWILERAEEQEFHSQDLITHYGAFMTKEDQQILIEQYQSELHNSY